MNQTLEHIGWCVSVLTIILALIESIAFSGDSDNSRAARVLHFIFAGLWTVTLSFVIYMAWVRW